MITALKLIFWISAFLVIYPYTFYPLILWCASKLKSRLSSKGSSDEVGIAEDVRKIYSVTLVISAYNEEAIISQKIENALSLDYQGELEIIVVSDGSDDHTVSILSEYMRKYKNIKIIELEEQVGKSSGLNVALPSATGEIVVFTDANAMFDKHAVSRLVAPFKYENVGYTVGAALYREQDQEAVNVSEGVYWRFEMWIKNLESNYHSVVGGDGAIYAIRRPLFKNLLSIDISDFVNPLQIIAAGYRGLFIPSAVSYEGGTEKFSDEFRRKRRIVNRSWSAVRRYFRLFSLKHHAQFLFMLVSHKVIRWWSFPLVILSLISSFIIAGQALSSLYWILFWLIAASLVVGFIGWRVDKAGFSMPKIIYLLYYFYLISVAGMLGIIDDFRGLNYATWKPMR